MPEGDEVRDGERVDGGDEAASPADEQDLLPAPTDLDGARVHADTSHKGRQGAASDCAASGQGIGSSAANRRSTFSVIRDTSLS